MTFADETCRHASAYTGTDDVDDGSTVVLHCHYPLLVSMRTLPLPVRRDADTKLHSDASRETILPLVIHRHRAKYSPLNSSVVVVVVCSLSLFDTSIC